MDISELVYRLGREARQSCDRNLGTRVCEILAGTNQQDLPDAIIADILDIIPIIGDLTNALRVIDAAGKGNEYQRKKKVAMQLIDALSGSLPDPVGAIIDAITPTNTILYLSKKGVLEV